MKRATRNLCSNVENQIAPEFAVKHDLCLEQHRWWFPKANSLEFMKYRKKGAILILTPFQYQYEHQFCNPRTKWLLTLIWLMAQQKLYCHASKTRTKKSVSKPSTDPDQLKTPEPLYNAPKNKKWEQIASTKPLLQHYKKLLLLLPLQYFHYILTCMTHT